MTPRRPKPPASPRPKARPGAKVVAETPEDSGAANSTRSQRSTTRSSAAPTDTAVVRAPHERNPQKSGAPDSRASMAGRSKAGVTPSSTQPRKESRVIDARERFRAAVTPPPWHRSRKPLLIGVAVVVALAAAVVAVLAFVPALKVADVRVQGAGYVDRTQIAAVVAPSRGKPLAFVDTSGLEDSAKSVPGISTAKVSRSWPDTLVVHVTERVPAGRLVRQGTTSTVDATGAKLPVSAGKGQALPQLVVPPTAKDADSVEAALFEVLGALPADVRSRVTTVTATAPSSVTLTMNVDGVAKTVVWGGPEDSALKAQVLDALATQPGSVIDLTTPHAPTVR